MGAKGKKALKIAVTVFIVAAITALILIFSFTNVFLLYGNDRSQAEYRSAAEADDAFYYKTDECNAFTEFVRIDKATCFRPRSELHRQNRRGLPQEAGI